MKPQPEPPGQALLDLFSRTSDAVIAMDSLSRIVAWNPAATALFGHTPAQVLGKCCADVLRWRDRHGNLVCGPECAIRKQAARELPGETQEVVATTRSGRAVWVSVSSLVLPRHYHRVCRVVHFAREVTITPLQEAAVRFVHDDQARRQLLRTLTAREHEVLDLLIAGAATTEIAARLSISPVTAKNHTAHIRARGQRPHAGHADDDGLGHAVRAIQRLTVPGAIPDEGRGAASPHPVLRFSGES